MEKDKFWKIWNVKIISEIGNVTFAKPKNYKDIIWDSIKHLDLDTVTKIATEFKVHYGSGLIAKFIKNE